MVDRASDAAIETRLRGYLATELRQAELDYPHLPLRKPGRRRLARPLGRVALAIGVVATVMLLRPWDGSLPGTTGGDPRGTDGLPLTIGGQPVLRGAEIDVRLGAGSDPTSFLAGGYLILHPAACSSAAPAPSGGCDEDWRLEDEAGGHSVRLTTVGGSAIFVRTSGAPTVFRVRPAVADTERQKTLIIEAVAWRQATKGRIPTEATPPEGGDINMALVPDFVGAWGGPTGEIIVGYAPKDLLLNPRSVVGGTLANPPQDIPVPVYGEDLTTLVGHMVAGQGFVALGSSPAPSGAIGSGSPSAGPSSASSSASLVTLPTLASDNGACRGVGLDALLAGDPADPRVTWLVGYGGRRQEIVWPSGFTARFAPDLQVLDASGVVVYQAGDKVEGGCTTGPADDPGKILLIRPRS